MKKVNISKGDIIADNGHGIYVLTQDDKKVSKKQFNEWLSESIIYYDRTQWGVEHYLVYDNEVTK